jgi:hypothetical protein
MEFSRKSIVSCCFIRSLLDVVDVEGDKPPLLALEWMESTLEGMDWHTHRKNYRLKEAVAAGILQALVAFDKEGRVHAGNT